MPWPARPTLRVLNDELEEDWEDRGHRHAATQPEGKIAPPPFHLLAHPVVRHAAEVFTGVAGKAGDVKRESISGLPAPVWWKFKTNRYRGAVYEDPDGQAWLCATGLRRKGDPDDFYKDFMAQVAGRGAGFYLPTEQDRGVLRVEQTGARLGDWEVEIQRLTRAGLQDAVASGSAKFTLPELTPPPATGAQPEVVLGEAEVDVEVVQDDGDPDGAVAEIVVTVHGDRSRPAVLARAELVILAAVNPDEQAWDPTYLADRRVYTCLLAVTDLRDLAARPAGPPGVTKPGATAHYALRGLLTESTVLGTAVRSMCGVWFVPRQDADPLEKCGPCIALHRELERQADA